MALAPLTSEPVQAVAAASLPGVAALLALLSVGSLFPMAPGGVAVLVRQVADRQAASWAQSGAPSPASAV